MTVRFLLAASLLTASEAHAQPVHVPAYVFMVAGNVADLATTHAAFKRGAVEGNGFLSGRPMKQLIFHKALFTAGLAMAMRILERRGHPWVAQWLGFTDGAVTIGFAIGNSRVMR